MELNVRWKGDGKTSSPRAVAAAGRIFMVVGLGCFVAALVIGIRTSKFVRESVHVTGRVTALSEAHDSENHSMGYAPVFSFTTRDGRVESISSKIASTPAGYTVGDEVAILYRPEDPSGALIDGFWQLWFWPVFIAIFGSAFPLAGTILLFVAKQQTAKQKAQAANAA